MKEKTYLNTGKDFDFVKEYNKKLAGFRKIKIKKLSENLGATESNQEYFGDEFYLVERVFSSKLELVYVFLLFGKGDYVRSSPIDYIQVVDEKTHIIKTSNSLYKLTFEVA